MRVAVTGANGFLGGNLLRTLSGAGMTVTALTRDARALVTAEASGITVRETDYSAVSITDWMSGQDAVVHLGGRRMARTDAPRELGPFLEPNLALTERVAAAAVTAGVGRVIFASTTAVYSALDAVPFAETHMPHPINAYGLSKLMGEQIIELICRGTKTTAVSLRFSALFGTGERTTGVLMRFVSEAAAGRDIVMSGNPRYGVDQLYVEDAAGAIVAALTSPSASGVYNVGGGRAWTVAEMAEAVAATCASPVSIRQEDFHDGPVPKPFMTIDKAARDLAWSPKFDLVSGLATMAGGAP
ncbi:NAD-dependent epimerase/dehydratase family protein [Shinella sp. M31]|uniref:NAD-dependent epimerase/dehydratase family protein n=1 Tax=Shinella sp. M31 TaxID=3368615 RepID=UPI003B9F4746